jgi:hypothetical protein
MESPAPVGEDRCQRGQASFYKLNGAGDRMRRSVPLPDTLPDTKMGIDPIVDALIAVVYRQVCRT